mmetsp:Transcript_39565/g.77320  ORF Transcript_39565/g.77320 Transcript_39565/m.77320 type:complete len:296 (-) Transcript_39565:226-1113(-)
MSVPAQGPEGRRERRQVVTRGGAEDEAEQGQREDVGGGLEQLRKHAHAWIMRRRRMILRICWGRLLEFGDALVVGRRKRQARNDGQDQGSDQSGNRSDRTEQTVRDEKTVDAGGLRRRQKCHHRRQGNAAVDKSRGDGERPARAQRRGQAQQRRLHQPVRARVGELRPEEREGEREDRQRRHQEHPERHPRDRLGHFGPHFRRERDVGRVGDEPGRPREGGVGDQRGDPRPVVLLVPVGRFFRRGIGDARGLAVEGGGGRLVRVGDQPCGLLLVLVGASAILAVLMLVTTDVNSS